MMRKKLLFFTFLSMTFMLASKQEIRACSVAGTVTANRDSICFEDTIIVNTTGYNGTSFQWQSNDGSGWVNETGSGSATDTYSVIPGSTKQYRVIVTATGCPADTSSGVAVNVGAIPVPSGVGGSRCGYGPVTLTGAGASNGTLRWYAAATGGSPLASGNSFTPTVGATTTFYLEDNTYSGGGGSSPLLITEMDINDEASGGTGDDLELQNVSSQPLDVTGWKVAVSNNNSNINAVNTVVQTLNGILQPGDIITFNDNASSANYWGSNFQWVLGTPPGTGNWSLIIDNNNVLRDIVFINWDSSAIASMSVVVNGVNITVGSQWNGDGVAMITGGANQGVVRSGIIDNNSSVDFSVANLTIGSTNPGMVLPYQGFGCSSPRIPVVATVNASTPATLSASPAALCLGQSSNLSVSTSSSSYSFTWSPATGLSGTTGTSVTATPVVPTTYYVVGSDGTCGAIDSVFISVGPTSVAGTATISADTVCAGTAITLSITGYTGNIQWQSNTGSGWVNETGTGATSAVYQFSPTVAASYRAEVTSGGCPSDISTSFNVGVINVTNPITVGDTVCAGGLANLSASGNGNMNWFTSSSGGTLLYSGNNYNVNIPATTTFYVQSNDGGSPVALGPPNKSFGSQSQSTPASYGLIFDVAQDATIDSVSIYPVNAGQVIISLYDASGSTQLNTKTFTVSASIIRIPLFLGFSVPPGTGYRLVMESGSVICGHNSLGATYPYVNASCPVSITGYLNPNPGAGTSYYYFYNWIVTDGCKSGFIPVTAVVIGPPQPTITASGSTLTSSPAANYQWLLNGVAISGAISQSFITSQPGAYTVQTTDAGTGCIITSDPFLIVSFLDVPLADAGVYLFPNPSADKFFMSFAKEFKGDAVVQIFNAVGQLATEQRMEDPSGKQIAVQTHLAKGVYQVRLLTVKGSFHSTLIKQ